MLNISMNILILVLNSARTLSTDFQVFISTWNGLSIQLSEQFNSNTTMSAQFLRSLQLRTSVYWQSISTLTLNEARIFQVMDFVEFLTYFLIQTWAQAIDILTTMVSRCCASVQEWQKNIGEPRSISLAIPGSRVCFSLLQHALKPGAQYITLTGPIKDQLKYFLWLSQYVKNRPTHIFDIVPTPPTYYRSANASKPGMGGI